MPTNRAASGHISFRLPVETHERLLEVAGHLGIDLTALLNQMIREVLPKYMRKARKVAQQQAEAQSGWPEATISPDDPLVSRLVAEGRSLPPDRRLEQLIDLAVRERQAEDPALEAIMHAVLGFLRREDEKKSVREAIERRSRHGR